MTPIDGMGPLEKDCLVWSWPNKACCVCYNPTCWAYDGKPMCSIQCRDIYNLAPIV